MSKQANENTNTGKAAKPNQSRKKAASTSIGTISAQDGLDVIHAALDYFRERGGTFEVFKIEKRGGVAIFLANTELADGLFRVADSIPENSGNPEVKS